MIYYVQIHTRTHSCTHARAHVCRHARTHARAHARRNARIHTHTPRDAHCWNKTLQSIIGLSIIVLYKSRNRDRRTWWTCTASLEAIEQILVQSDNEYLRDAEQKLWQSKRLMLLQTFIKFIWSPVENMQIHLLMLLKIMNYTNHEA